MTRAQNEIVLILLDIRSVYNVGAIFRTADAAGVSKICLCGYTPTPQDRFGRIRRDVAKTALGAEQTVPWEAHTDSIDCLKKLRKAGFSLVVLEQAPNSIDYKKCKVSKKTALVVGNETKGIPSEIVSLCDTVIEIPMRGKKESLNVSVATGIALFRLLNF